MKDNNIKIVIGGDICPVNRNLPFFMAGDVQSIFNDILVEFKNSDLSIVNLECPLISVNTPILKEGPVLGVNSECINSFKKAHINVLGMANNHIMDHGATGLLNTLRVCSEAGLSTVGAGENLQAASKILVKKIKDKRIGILGVAEHEFSIAAEDKPGANPLDIVSYVRTVNAQRRNLDYLIVLVHAGTEGYPLPSPRLQEICRFMAEMGADAVICQHSHCAGAYEYYEESHIVYGQGNFIYDEDPNPDSHWNKGYMVKLTLFQKHEHVMDLIPYVQAGKMIGVRKMPKDDAKLLMNEINKISSMTNDSSFIQKEWIRESEKKKDKYLFQLILGFLNNRFFRRIHSILPFTRYILSKKHLVLLENMIKCESHREVIETILEDARTNPKIK